MRNFPFQTPLTGQVRSELLRDDFTQRDIHDAYISLAEYSVTNTSGVPTYAGIGDASQVYQVSKPRKVRAVENIPRGAAVNLHYVNEELVARRATNSLLVRYCNAISLTAGVANSLISFQENTGYLAVAAQTVKLPAQSHIFLGANFGEFSTIGAGRELIQLCGFTDAVGDFFYSYFPPVALRTEIYTNDNNSY